MNVCLHAYIKLLQWKLSEVTTFGTKIIGYIWIGGLAMQVVVK